MEIWQVWRRWKQMAVPGGTSCNCWSIRSREATPPCPVICLRVSLLRKISGSSFGPYAVLESWPRVRRKKWEMPVAPYRGHLTWPRLGSLCETNCYLSHPAWEPRVEVKPQIMLPMRTDTNNHRCDNTRRTPHSTVSAILTATGQQSFGLCINIPILPKRKAHLTRSEGTCQTPNGRTQIQNIVWPQRQGP